VLLSCAHNEVVTVGMTGTGAAAGSATAAEEALLSACTLFAAACSLAAEDAGLGAGSGRSGSLLRSGAAIKGVTSPADGDNWASEAGSGWLLVLSQGSVIVVAVD
jgi:hypothetical protein